VTKVSEFYYYIKEYYMKNIALELFSYYFKIFWKTKLTYYKILIDTTIISGFCEPIKKKPAKIVGMRSI